MDSSLISKILMQQVTDLVERQKTVSPDEIAEEVVNSCCYFILKRRKDMIAAHPSPAVIFDSIADSMKFAQELIGNFRDVAVQLFKGITL